MKMRLSQKITQNMALTPQMRQSMHILQIPLLELKTYVEGQMEENPFLENEQEKSIDENSAADGNLEAGAQAVEENSGEAEDYFDENEQPRETRENKDYRENLLVKHLTLQEHLLRQLRLIALNDGDYKIGEFIISNIDENGYFTSSIDETAEILEIDAQDALRMLSLIQSFEPLGVGARNLKECLCIQLKLKGRQNSLAYKIAENYLPELARNKIKLIARKMKISPLSVKQAEKEISSLEPKPGRSFSPGQITQRVLPDIFLEKIEDGYVICLNERELPRLKISRYHKNLLSQRNIAQDTKKYLNERMNSALFLIKSIRMRQETIRKIAECLLEKQKEFFTTGEKDHLKPLSMKDVAGAVSRSESTVSRTVNNKYIQTPYGMFELRYFFSGSYEVTEGTAIPRDTLKSRVLGLIENENPRSPLSDDEIVKAIGAQGIQIARRTIAKYRKELKIPPSHLRKKTDG
jgi:RNA polymerase sigma-54 factor